MSYFTIPRTVSVLPFDTSSSSSAAVMYRQQSQWPYTIALLDRYRLHLVGLPLTWDYLDDSLWTVFNAGLVATMVLASPQNYVSIGQLFAEDIRLVEEKDALVKLLKTNYGDTVRLCIERMDNNAIDILTAPRDAQPDMTTAGDACRFCGQSCSPWKDQWERERRECAHCGGPPR